MSSLGIRALSQYSLLGTISARSRGANSVSFQGPVPDGVLANASQLLPSFSHCAGDDIMIQASLVGQGRVRRFGDDLQRILVDRLVGRDRWNAGAALG